jgi:hypothetical protein
MWTRVSRPDILGGRAVCAGGPDGHAMCRWSGSYNWYQRQVGPVHSQTNLGSQCVRRRLLGIVPHCVVRARKHGFIWLRVQPPERLAFWGECWPKKPKACCYTCGRVCRGPTAWVDASCVRAVPMDTPCVGGPVPTT